MPQPPGSPVIRYRIKRKRCLLTSGLIHDRMLSMYRVQNGFDGLCPLLYAFTQLVYAQNRQGKEEKILNHKQEFC